MGEDDEEREQPRIGSLNRREFLKKSAVVGLATPLLSAPSAAQTGLNATGAPRIRRRRVLGKTGIEVPDISFGTWALKGDENVVRHALDLGVTHFDTAPDYGKGMAEETLGRALRTSRDKVTIATKFAIRPHNTVEDMMGFLDESLKRLQTDYVDIFINHAVNSLDRARHPGWLEFTSRAKEQGKMRACGYSGHAGNLAECVDVALDEDLVDILLVAHNYAAMPGFWEMGLRFKDRFTGGFDFVAYQSEMPRLLAKAHAKGVGTLVMKTRRGARYNDLTRFQLDGATQEQAAFRWVLSDSNVDGLVVTMGTREKVDQFVAASGWQGPTSADTQSLLQYESANAGTLCQQGCGDCTHACPAGVEIGEVLRTRMYAADYGEPEIARAEYEQIQTNASACATCTNPVCQAVCPGSLRIQELTSDAHRRLG